ncbi:MAG: FkbM family methyltransferase [Lachnospiraceae bacterium]|nr:FkbM family methyltransferase [Lachnospiraceae bacterium]
MRSTIFKKIKRRMGRGKRRALLTSCTREYNVVRYGNAYGGFCIYDEKLKAAASPVIYTFGIGEDLSFSEALSDAFDPEIYAFDPTPRAGIYVKQHRLSDRKTFHFSPVGLSSKDGTELFYLPENDDFVSGSAVTRDGMKEKGITVDMRTIDTLAKENGHEHIDLLKMDIEGSEFEVIRGYDPRSVTIDQICMEVHDRFFDDGPERLVSLLDKMKELGYCLIHVSGNGNELTFLKDV